MISSPYYPICPLSKRKKKEDSKQKFYEVGMMLAARAFLFFWGNHWDASVQQPIQRCSGNEIEKRAGQFFQFKICSTTSSSSSRRCFKRKQLACFHYWLTACFHYWLTLFNPFRFLSADQRPAVVHT